MRDTLNTINHHNRTINAIVSLHDESLLLSQAERADKTPVSGSLHGIPIALKDLVNVAGIKSTFGSPLLADNIPGKDDLVAQRPSCVKSSKVNTNISFTEGLICITGSAFARTRQLRSHLLKMIAVDIRITQRMHKLTKLKITHQGNHHRKQRMRCDAKRFSG